jgi:hypothetical protein
VPVSGLVLAPQVNSGVRSSRWSEKRDAVESMPLPATMVQAVRMLWISVRVVP